MPFEIVWTKRAETDLDGIVDHIALDNAETAATVAGQIVSAVDTLAEFPGRTRVIPELISQNLVLYRELIVSVWRVIIHIGDEKVYIIAIIDSRRNVEDVLYKKLVL